MVRRGRCDGAVYLRPAECADTAAARTTAERRPESGALLRWLVSESRRHRHALVRVLQPESRGTRGDPARTGQRDYTQRVRWTPADLFSADRLGFRERERRR